MCKSEAAFEDEVLCAYVGGGVHQQEQGTQALRIAGVQQLKDPEGGQMNAMLNCAKHNMRIILKNNRTVCDNL